MFDILMDMFASAATKTVAREEALLAIRTHGAGAVAYLEARRLRTGSKNRRQIYRIAEAMVPKLTRE